MVPKGQEIIEIAKTVLKDFNRNNYVPDSFRIFPPEKVEKRERSPFSFDSWEVAVKVPDEQWVGALSFFAIFIKDETMEPFMFWDGGAEGRTLKLEIVKKNGKYTIGKEWKQESAE